MDQTKLDAGIKYALKQYNTFGKFKENIMQLIKPNKSMQVLDFGSGMGAKACWIANHVESVVGFEIDIDYLSVSKKVQQVLGLKNIRFMRFNILNQNLTQKFDLIMINDVIEHLPKQHLNKILFILKSYLKQNGKIYIQYPPWSGPWAAHTNHILPYLPWIQFLPFKLVKKLIKINDHDLIGNIEPTVLNVYNGLNRLTPTKLKKILNNLDYKIVYRKAFGKLPLACLTTFETLILKNNTSIIG